MAARPRKNNVSVPNLYPLVMLPTY
ncbi:phage integrase Arm DNA-binding domain-containing protein [Escherichia coli]